MIIQNFPRELHIPVKYFMEDEKKGFTTCLLSTTCIKYERERERKKSICLHYFANKFHTDVMLCESFTCYENRAEFIVTTVTKNI